MTRITTLGLALLLLAPVPDRAVSQENSPNRSRVWNKADRERIEAWESLKPEQREKLREALREVWTDPSVINAREEVKQASDAYQAAIKAAVAKVDPEVGEMLAKVQSMQGASPAGPPPGGPMAMRGFDHEIRPPGFFDSLPPEQREKVRQAESAALESEIVKTARAELNAIRKEDDGIRRKRVEAHRRLREATVEEMLRLDPSLVPLERKLLGIDRNRPPRKDDEKGKPARQDKPERGAPERQAPDPKEAEDEVSPEKPAE